MEEKKIFHEDLKIAKAILRRDAKITQKFFYKECYPLFKSFYDNYYTDCECCKEFIDEIYTVVLTPGPKTGKCQLENFRGESTLKSWIKVCCLFYCYDKYKRRIKTKDVPPSHGGDNDDGESSGGDRNDAIYGSEEIDLSGMNRADVEVLLSMMPNTRYRSIIRLRYLEQRTHEETAEALGMTMANYYNKRKRAVEQFLKVYRKEEDNV